MIQFITIETNFKVKIKRSLISFNIITHMLNMTYKEKSLGRKEIFLFQGKTWVVFTHLFFRDVGYGKQSPQGNWTRILLQWVFLQCGRSQEDEGEGYFPEAWLTGRVKAEGIVISTYFICPAPHLLGLEKFNLHLKISFNCNLIGIRTLNWEQEEY